MVTDRGQISRILKEERRITTSGSFMLKEGDKANVKKVSAVITDAYYPKDVLIDLATETVRDNIDTNTDILHKRHTDAWSKRWRASDIVIDADDHEGYNSQLAIRTVIYHLLRCRAEDEERAQSCPKATTSEVYFGGCFWDMEMFILPFYLYTNPKAAKTTPMFRYRTLPAARRLAQEQGYQGARYPWTAAIDGSETCPDWDVAETEVHVVSAVAVGVWHYYLVTGDKEFLYDYGAEVLIETARYWATRVDEIPGKHGYQINGVMGPDEYKVMINNNAYTNHFAKFNLSIAADAIDILASEAPDKLEELSKRIALDDAEKGLFRRVAAGIHIPIDKERHIIWQCDDFDSIFVPIDIDGLWKDRREPFGIFVSKERKFRSKCLKQSDTIALLAVFPESYSLRQREASFDYYDPITTHDSSNSISSHAIAAANINRPQIAYECWKKSMDIDFRRVPSASNGIHGVNTGGMWGEVVFGFVGLVNALNTDVLTFNPSMPREFKTIQLKILWKNSRIKVAVTQKQIELENESENDLPVRVKSKEYRLKAKEKRSIGY
jgi:kojibiose phosphorylase